MSRPTGAHERARRVDACESSGRLRRAPGRRSLRMVCVVSPAKQYLGRPSGQHSLRAIARPSRSAPGRFCCPEEVGPLKHARLRRANDDVIGDDVGVGTLTASCASSLICENHRESSLRRCSVQDGTNHWHRCLPATAKFPASLRLTEEAPGRRGVRRVSKRSWKMRWSDLFFVSQHKSRRPFSAAQL